MTKFQAEIRAMSIAIRLKNRARSRLNNGIYTATSLTTKDPKIDTALISPSGTLTSPLSTSSSACSTLVSTPTTPSSTISFKEKYNAACTIHRHHNPKRERSYATDPTFRWNLQRPVPQLILFWETVSLVGSAIARRCAGIRFVRTESVSQTPPKGPENIPQLKAKLDPLFAVHKELSARVDKLVKENNNNEKTPSDSDDRVLHLSTHELVETLKDVIWSLNSTKKFLENAESNLGSFHIRLPLTKSEIAREYYHVRLDQYSYYCDNLFPVNFESNQNSLKRVKQSLDKIERAIARKSGQGNVEKGMEEKEKERMKEGDVPSIAQEQREKPKETEESQQQKVKETPNIQTQGSTPSTPITTNIATQQQQQIRPQTPTRNTRNKLSPPANFSQMSPAQQAAFLRPTPVNTPVSPSPSGQQQQKTPVTKDTPTGKLPNFPTPSGQQVTATPVRTSSSIGKSPKILGKPATLVRNSPVITATSQPPTLSTATTTSAQKSPTIVILSPDSTQVQQQSSTTPQTTPLIEEIPPNAPEIAHIQIDQPTEVASPAPDPMDVDESKTTNTNTNENNSNEPIIEILETSEFPSSSVSDQRPEVTILEQPPSVTVINEQNQ
ncbi:4049_t:CDS:2 [Ambispora leptoticha]|uniref:4049_t:CDS:1 n=1 Tax=Ambispora leptoticha TaxID=144679 RepID=A0A9N9AY94_9GLOM|nr:4049_t:CDS:2 [Ambispora leptoticha]